MRLHGWLPYWFIASSRQDEVTSVQFLRGVCRFVRHAPPEDATLKSSPLGLGTVRRLASSNREVRLAAADAVLAYSRPSRSDSGNVGELRRINRAETMRALVKLAQDIKEPSIVEETLQLVAGGVGCACELQESTLGEVLLFLLEYYCRDNVFLRAVAMEQLLLVAQEHGISLTRLLSAFAGSIACTLACTLAQQSPRSFVHCMQILETTPKQFLRQHQDVILPHLVASGNEAALKNVAGILDVQLPVLCINQAPVVFVKIFLMDDQLMHEAMLRFVRLISSGSGVNADQVEVNIPSLLRSCSVKLIFNLILSLGEEDGVLRRRARSALLTVQHILASTGLDATHGVSTIVQKSVDNLKGVASNHSPKAGNDPQQQQHQSSSELADFLSQHILGVLAYVNELLRDSETFAGSNKMDNVVAHHQQQRKRMVLRAIGELTTLLGPRSMPFTTNIVASLTPPLDGPLADAALHTWGILAENLSLSILSADQLNSLIVPLLTTFVTSDETTRRGAASTVNRVVKLHEKAVEQHFMRLCPIPNESLLTESYEVMQRLLKAQPLVSRIMHLARLLKTKDATIVMCASNELDSLIRQNEKTFGRWKQRLAPGLNGGRLALDEHLTHSSEGESEAQLIASTVDALKLACSVSGRLAGIAAASCAACMAAIGAVSGHAQESASRSRLLTAGANSSGHTSTTFYDVRDSDGQMDIIVRLIIDHLSLTFASAPSPGVQTCAAYTIQELMRHIGFTSDLLCADRGDKRGASLASVPATGKPNRRDAVKRPQLSAREQTLCAMWGALPPDVVEIIKPLLDTKYAIQQSGRPAVGAKHPRVPCVLRAASHVVWLRLIVVELINALPSKSMYSVFKLCTSAMKEGSVDMLMFLLPQVAYQHCLLAASKGHGFTKPILIDDEDDDDDSDTGNGRAGSEGGSKLLDENTSIIGEEIKAIFSSSSDSITMAADQWRLCKEAALDLLDSLSNHLREQQASRINNKRGARKDAKLANTTPEEQAVLSLMESVPSGLIAQAAASCLQYERALLHTEVSLREGQFGKHPTLFGNVDDAAVAAIQELYFSMGDADGVAGAASCRKQTDLKLSIRKYEIEGNWSHALIGHESLLRSQPENEEYQRGWISCLQKMGQWEGAWAASKELFQSGSAREGDPQLGAACFAAAWRLGKWDWVLSAVGKETQEAELTTSAGSWGARNALPAFDALNSALLLRISRDISSDMQKLVQPLQLRASAFAGHGSASSVLGCPMEELSSLAFRAVGRGIAETATFRKQAFSSLIAPAGIHDAQHDVHAHMLGDIALFARHVGDFGSGASGRTGRLSGALSTLAEQWRTRVSYLPAAYAVQEPVLALHARLYDMVLSKCASQASDADRGACTDIIMRQVVRTHLQAAQLARLAGFRATALGILTHGELTCTATPALLAPLQIEHAQILWDEGFVADAMSAIGRVADRLWAKLSSQDDSDLCAETTFTADSGLMSSGSQAADVDAVASRPHSSADVDDTKAAFAKASLLLSRWQEDTNAVSTAALLARYERIVRVQESDKVHYALGHLYDSLFTSLSEKDSSRTSKPQQDHRCLQLASLQYYVIRHYGRAVIYSLRYLFQALPRLLTVWLDFGAQVAQPAEAKNKRLVERFNTTNRAMGNIAKRLQTYAFLVVLSQLVSRICHVHSEVFGVLESIILGVLELYPQQALWQLMGVQRSTYAARSERCNVILAKARSSQGAEAMGAAAGRGRGRGVGVGGLIQQASKLTDMLLGLCNAVPPARTVTAMHMSKDFKQLLRSTPLDIIVPLERCLVPTLPDASSGAENELALSLPLGGAPAHSAAQRAMLHQPFSSDLPTISSFADEIEVMSSLQRPKRITMRGSDGREYSFLCKPKDDLRKDARLMEFNSMINQLLASNAQARKRRLRIRTYAVVPLNEECGLIQWVAPTTGVRHVLLRLYKAHGVAISIPQVKAILEKTSPSPEQLFTGTLLPLFPSVLHEWFLQSFPDPPRWLESRTNFTRSAAVMSMVGHILGLGDRHCENILLDESTGAVLHVDFNCLFEKGLALEKPERVPFRLTHNMVDAMGVMGYEGAFRKTCEMTLSLLREHRDALMSVLESFLHDPLVEWSKRATRSSRAPGAKEPSASAQPNEHAARSLHTIDRKLQGILQGIVPLSVEGQVDELIREATDPKRLFQMYIGWAAYM
ncbi:hypothetical protein EV174_000288 [Coemansia sp. RSA 2320]|nr:hypothetical protein EV174_000288 [Coemansia sp. RSA 2320]